MDLQSMPLRQRLQIGFIAVTAVLGLVAVIVGVQFVVTYSSAMRLQERLAPAAELTDALLLAQTAASGDLSDYVLTDRKRALNGYQDAVADAETLIGVIEATVEDDAALLGQLTGVRAAQQVWVADDAAPTLEQMERGNTAEAARITNLPKAWDSYDAMIAATIDFRDAIESSRNDARSRVDSFARQLGWWMVLLGVALLAAVLVAGYALNTWVLRPLVAIRRDLGAAAKDQHTHPITRTGPPELAAVAGDAEDLRRSLVAEIDEAKAARAGLAQDAPLVAEMRKAFQAPSLDSVAGIGVAGSSASAEGVLAGDWWDAIAVSDSRLGIVVGDTSGHGTGATITALRTRDLLRSALATEHGPAQAVELAAVACASEDNYVTAFLAVIDTATNTMTFTNAGHLPAVLVTADKESVMCEPTGPLISALGGQWTSRTIPFGVADCLFAFTDGLIERHGPAGTDLEPSDISRAIRTLDAPVRQDAEEVLARVIGQIRERSPAWQRDDVTVVTVTRPGMAL